MVSLLKYQFNQSDSDNTPHNKIEVLIRDSCTILLSRNITLLIQLMKWDIIQNVKLYFFDEIHEKLIYT